MMNNVLGLNIGHNATACLMQNGELTHCISEERFTRVKNFLGIPVHSIEWILRDAGISAEELTHICIFGSHSPLSASLPVNPLNAPRAPLLSPFNLLRKGIVGLEYCFPLLGRVAGAFYRKLLTFTFNRSFSKILCLLKDRFGFSKDKVITVEHHRGHALCAALLVPWDSKALVFSCDGEGDNVSATVSVLHRGKLERIAETPADDSLGILYLKVTEYLGMKGNEHEFKVMGMAPYAKPEHVEKLYPVFQKILWFDPKHPLQFRSPYRMTSIEHRLKKWLYRKRFDTIAGAIQKLTEELTVEWVRRAIQQTGIKTVVLTGGVFMNVKANQLIGEMPEVEHLYVFPSCGDESGAIGSAIEGVLKTVKASDLEHSPFTPLHHLYLGTDDAADLEQWLHSKEITSRYDVRHCDDIENVVADCLAQGKVVARFNGRMEWGARALGNRSILANPSDPNIIRIINEQVKDRDFWMPFASSILKERAQDYLINPKHISAPYMAVTFNTTELAQRHLSAAIHPYDFTVRPQLVEKEWNPSYHRLLCEFEKRTGIGGILNTSFNLHGEPNVQSFHDAIHTLNESNLSILAAGSYLLTKKAKQEHPLPSSHNPENHTEPCVNNHR